MVTVLQPWQILDGNGTFGPKQVISSILGDSFVTVADMDGDLDPDVISASAGADTFAWYENLDGGGSFSSRPVSSDTVDDVRSISLHDFDDDGELDVLAVSSDQSIVAWWRQGGDRVGDACDNCPLMDNADQSDTDLDEIGDSVGDPGFPNSCDLDNCPDLANATQDDGDGEGDVCDLDAKRGHHLLERAVHPVARGRPDTLASAGCAESQEPSPDAKQRQTYVVLEYSRCRNGKHPLLIGNVICFTCLTKR